MGSNWRILLKQSALGAIGGCASIAVALAAPPPDDAFQKHVRPLLQQYCFDCHGEKAKGDLDLRAYPNAAAVQQNRDLFERVLKNLESGAMPPRSRPQPQAAERQQLVDWINETVFPVDCTRPDPGRVTVRRLNRAEYNNTIRDLLGVDVQPARDFPADDSGYGFDNIGDVLSLSPILLEKYYAAAGRILDRAVVADPAQYGPTLSLAPAGLEASGGVGKLGETGAILFSEGHLSRRMTFRDGAYRLRVRAFGEQAGSEPPRLLVSLDNTPLATNDIIAVRGTPQTCDVQLRPGAGDHTLRFAFVNDYYDPDEPKADRRDRNLILQHIELSGPLGVDPLPESHRQVFVAEPDRDPTQAARAILEPFARRAYRRPVAPAEVDRLVRLFQSAHAEGEGFHAAVRFALQAVLVSPNFLFRGERPAPARTGTAVEPIDDFALASRLSYFLWSSMPDAELFELAERGTLRRHLDAQVRRLLRDPKSRAFVRNFSGQWLQLRNLRLSAPDPQLFPGFNEELREAMVTETEMFFAAILEEDRSVLELLGADFTFVNGPLARLYAIQGVNGDAFQRINARAAGRGGLLTQASILTLTSNPTRTSPVKRGKWVLDNLLGTPPPPPPPNVPELKTAAELQGTLRQRLEQHRENPLCASCHDRMDPIGFALEHYDGIGAWRERDGEAPIDASGQFAAGEAFEGSTGLKRLILTTRREEFVRCLAGKLLTYALGRGLEYYDRCAVDQVVQATARDGYRIQSLILEITRTVPFQMRRTDPAAHVASR